MTMPTQPMPQAPSPAPSEAISALYLADEAALASRLAGDITFDATTTNAVQMQAGKWVAQVRASAGRSGIIDAFLQEYGLSSEEGILLMRLSEALIRTPDFATARTLMRDKLGAGRWAQHKGGSPAMLINAATLSLSLSALWIKSSGGTGAARLAARLGDKVLHAAVERGMGIMAEHFVLGATIEHATARADTDGRYSYDMLGEAASTAADAERYFAAYSHAARHLASLASTGTRIADAPGLSVKLSALHPRYAWAQRDACLPLLLARLQALCATSKAANIGLTIDAEESDRLELSLIIFEALLNDPALAGWDGLGLVVQAYQRRAGAVIDHVVAHARAAGRRIAIRLVKGAYWDAEIKRAQVMGLASYPVFTAKEHTDISYLACARKLLAATDVVYPQFATHNAHSAAAIATIARPDQPIEFQRLHGMGEQLHAAIARDTGRHSRVYAPVGGHKDLLPYLVRRLLENGANSSFVHQLMNPDVDMANIIRHPVDLAAARGFSPNPDIPAPRDLFSGKRLSAAGLDLTQAIVAAQAQSICLPEDMKRAAPMLGDSAPPSLAQVNAGQPVRNPADSTRIIGHVIQASPADVERAIAAAQNFVAGNSLVPAARHAMLMRMAELLEQNMPGLMALCVAEAGKTLPNAVDEVREAVDFCRYYAQQCLTERIATRAPLGIVACISPWNFPLAIFIGQVAAVLAGGNAVIAKPAPQTPLIAAEAMRLLRAAGVPAEAAQLLPGGGDIGARLAASPAIDALCFTGSTATALAIATARANAGRAAAPLIAETGGINAMIVDSTALLEQAVRDVVSSAFQSAGQRCSACRIVCVQDDIADDFCTMLAGAMAELRLGDPAHLSTDIGPLIDAGAHGRITDYIATMRASHPVVGEAGLGEQSIPVHGHFVRPIAFAVDGVGAVEREVFGPVLHVVRYAAQGLEDLVKAINALGYGLTLGLHTRIDTRVDKVIGCAHVGNIYVNRNQIGAVVGVQPFGGEGLSGTGPKAGGPHYLLRLTQGALAASDRQPVTIPLASTAPAPAVLRAIATARAAAGNANIKAVRQEIARLCAAGVLPHSTALEAMLAVPLCHPLPGPTGEENSLSLVARGVLLAIDNNQPERLVEAALLALASGNAVLLCSTGDGNTAARAAIGCAPLVALCAQGVVTPAMMALVEPAHLHTLISRHVDGVIAGNDFASFVCAAGAGGGRIVPRLAPGEEPERYFHERTLTINTTAAGGNTALLAQ